MKIDHLLNACRLHEEFLKSLHLAHTDAVNSGNQFAEIVILTMLEEATKSSQHLARIREAAQ